MSARSVRTSLAAAVALLVAGTATAQQPAPPPPQAATKTMSQSLGIMVFPAKGQTPEQQGKDESDCYGWAKQQTGYDPVAPPPATLARAPRSALRWAP
jgi:hypothetical protein